MIEDMGLKIIATRSPLMTLAYICTKFHKTLPSGSKVISGGHTDRLTGDLISLLSFLEGRLKKRFNIQTQMEICLLAYIPKRGK
jgi:hypothetical protein